MVKQLIKRTAIQGSVFLFCLTLATGCGLHKWWGEKAEPAHIVHQDNARATSPGNADCQDWKFIYQGTEEQSRSTFECWAARTPELWEKIQGAHSNELSEREISLLIRKGVIDLSGDREVWVRRVLAAKDLLGFGPNVTRARLDQWIAWIRANRSEIRSLYQHLVLHGDSSSILYTDAQRASALLSSFLRELDWKKSTAELARETQDLFNFQDADFRSGLEPGIKVLRNLLGFVCPMNGPNDEVDPDQLAACLRKSSSFFQPSARWFEFMVNPKDDVLEDKVAAILQSLKATSPLVDRWFHQPGLETLNTNLWFDWAKKIGAEPPGNFIDSLRFLRRLKSRSNENQIDPADMVRAFSMVDQYERSVLDALPVFAREFQDHDCLNTDATSWKDCALSRFSVRKKSPMIDLMLRVKNPRNGLEAVPMNGHVMSSIAFFDSAAEELIRIFDENGDGFISANLKDSHDELVELITTSVETYQAFRRYLKNLGARLDGHAVAPADPALTLSHWDLEGFAKLVATTHDVLVERTPEQRNIIEKLLANLSNNFPKSSLLLDRPAITAILTTITSLPHYRLVALKAILGDDKQAQKVMDDNTPIPRALFQARLYRLLQRNFPRTYESCREFGFDISCGVAFDQIMPASDQGRDLINPSDLDIVSIMGISMEGVFDTCDRDGDAKLASSLVDGEDELDCGFTRLKDITQRLLESKVIRTDPSTRQSAESLLNTINSIFITRAIGKVALIRGTMDQAWANLPLFWAFGKKATIGSAYGLMSDIIASRRVDEIKKRSAK